MAPGILDGFLFVVCATAFCFPWMFGLHNGLGKPR